MKVHWDALINFNPLICRIMLDNKGNARRNPAVISFEEVDLNCFLKTTDRTNVASINLYSKNKATEEPCTASLVMGNDIPQKHVPNNNSSK